MSEGLYESTSEKIYENFGVNRNMLFVYQSYIDEMDSI